MAEIAGVPIYQSALAISRIQFRFPKSKCKRIRKKWRKNPDNFKEIPAVYQVGKSFVAHPVLYTQIRDAINEKQEAYEKKWR